LSAATFRNYEVSASSPGVRSRPRRWLWWGRRPCQEPAVALPLIELTGYLAVRQEPVRPRQRLGGDIHAGRSAREADPPSCRRDRGRHGWPQRAGAPGRGCLV